MITRSWKVYGADGHRQRESFCKSYRLDFSNDRDGIFENSRVGKIEEI